MFFFASNEVALGDNKIQVGFILWVTNNIQFHSFFFLFIWCPLNNGWEADLSKICVDYDTIVYAGLNSKMQNVPTLRMAQ